MTRRRSSDASTLRNRRVSNRSSSQPSLSPPSPPARDMATISAPLPSADDSVPSTEAASSKRLLVPSSTGLEGGVEGRKVERARVDEPPPPSIPGASLALVNTLTSQSPTDASLYVRGQAVQVTQWKEETETANIFLREDDTEMMIKVELKGAWASKMDLPKISSFVAVLLQGASWERAGDAVSSLVFRQGVKMKWGKHSIDTFTLACKPLDTSPHPAASISGSSSLEDIERLTAQRPSSEATPPPPDLPPATPSLISPTKADPPLFPTVPAKRPLPTSTEAGPSSKKSAPSPSVPSPAFSISIAASTPSEISAKMRSVITAKLRLLADAELEASASLLKQVVDAIVLLRKDELKRCLFDAEFLAEQVVMAKMFVDFDDEAAGEEHSSAMDVELPVVRVEEPSSPKNVEGSAAAPEPAFQKSKSASSQSVQPPLPRLATSEVSPVTPLVPSPHPPASSLPPAPSAIGGPSRIPPHSPVPAPQSPVALTTKLNLKLASLASTSSHRSDSLASISSASTTSTHGSKGLNKAEKKAAARKRDAEAGGGNVVGGGPNGSEKAKGSEKRIRLSRMAIEDGRFELGLTAGKHVYSSIADLRAFPSGARRRHTIGVVMNIQPLRHSKAGQPFVTLQIEDPSGQIGVKMFSHVQSSLPLQPKLQIGSVLLLRDLKRGEFKGVPDLVGTSYDGYSWGFTDIDVESFVSQPLRPTTRDLENLSTLGPPIESYMRKLAAWGRKKYNLVKDESEVVSFKDESLVPKLRGRRTLRVEEIKNEREFFDIIGQVVKTEFTASAKDFWITDWTSNDLLEDSGPPVSYDADPSEPFGTHCLKVSAWKKLATEITSSLRKGKIVRLKNVKPRVKNFWEGSMYDDTGCEIQRVLPSPELTALFDRRTAFLADLRADTTDDPLPERASMVQRAAPSSAIPRQTLPVEDLKPEMFFNLVCQVVRLRYLDSANSTVLEVTDFGENPLIGLSRQPPPASNPPTTRFGRYVLQVTLWGDEGRGATIQQLVPGDFIKLENVNARLHDGKLIAHVNSRNVKSPAPTVTVVWEEDDSLVGLLSRRHMYFNSPRGGNDNLANYRPPPPPPAFVQPALGQQLASLNDDDTKRIKDFVVGDTVDCIVQIVSVRPNGDPKVLLVTDFTSNPFINSASSPRAPEESVFPKGEFGRCVLTVWIEQSVPLEEGFLDSLVEGKLVVLRRLKIDASNRTLVGVIGAGNRASVTRVREDDPRAASFLQLRHRYYNPSAGAPALQAPSRPPTASTVVRQPSPASRRALPTPSISSAVKLELEEASINAVAGPSRRALPHVEPVVLGLSISGGATAAIQDVSPTQALLQDSGHLDKTSLQQIAQSSRSEFLTLARITAFFPQDLKEIVVSTCDACDSCLDPSETKCISCPCGSEDVVSQTYRLVLVLDDESGASLTAALWGVEVLALFPFLPHNPADFADAPSSIIEELRSKLQILVPHLFAKEKTTMAPLLELGIRRRVVRVGKGDNELVKKVFSEVVGTRWR